MRDPLVAPLFSEPKHSAITSRIMSADDLKLSGTRFSIEYHLTGNEAEARAKAEAICLDQTVELPQPLVPSGRIHDEIIGRLVSFGPIAHGRYQAVISFPAEVGGVDFTQLLTAVFGISSLKPGIRVARLILPTEMLGRWSGARFGREGLRQLVGVRDRALVCGVLKPVGLSVNELVNLAYQLASGGLDLVKEDQSLFDQAFCPYEERVVRCAEAVAKANRETGRHCLYVPHVSAPWDVMRQRALFAKQVGAGGLLVSPGVTGFDAVRSLAGDDGLSLPILTHPGMLGSYMVSEDSGIAPYVLFGQLPRLAGADASIYPSYDAGFPMSREDCERIADETVRPWEHLKPIFPTAAGRMELERVREACEFYRNEVIIIVGGGVIGPGADVAANCQKFIEDVSRYARA